MKFTMIVLNSESQLHLLIYQKHLICDTTQLSIKIAHTRRAHTDQDKPVFFNPFFEPRHIVFTLKKSHVTPPPKNIIK